MFGQMRENAPLPQISKKPVASISKGITGWCLSTDGQWLSKDNIIPLRQNSQADLKFMKKEENIGTDNIQELDLYTVVYGKDTLIMLTKTSQAGFYELAEIQKKWREYTYLWYYIISRDDLPQLLGGTESAELVRIPLLAEGKLTNPSGDVTAAIAADLNLTRPSNHELIFTSRLVKAPSEEKTDDKEAPKLLQFQLYAYHPGSGDISGSVNEFSVKGKSLMNYVDLLSHCYYELDQGSWAGFLSADLSAGKF